MFRIRSYDSLLESRPNYFPDIPYNKSYSGLVELKGKPSNILDVSTMKILIIRRDLVSYQRYVQDHEKFNLPFLTQDEYELLMDLY